MSSTAKSKSACVCVCLCVFGSMDVGGIVSVFVKRWLNCKGKATLVEVSCYYAVKFLPVWRSVHLLVPSACVVCVCVCVSICVCLLFTWLGAGSQEVNNVEMRTEMSHDLQFRHQGLFLTGACSGWKKKQWPWLHRHTYNRKHAKQYIQTKPPPPSEFYY